MQHIVQNVEKSSLASVYCGLSLADFQPKEFHLARESLSDMKDAFWLSAMHLCSLPSPLGEVGTHQKYPCHHQHSSHCCLGPELPCYSSATREKDSAFLPGRFPIKHMVSFSQSLTSPGVQEDFILIKLLQRGITVRQVREPFSSWKINLHWAKLKRCLVTPKHLPWCYLASWSR